MLGFAASLQALTVALARDPVRSLEPTARFASGLTAAGLAAVGRSAGRDADSVICPDAGDRRFADSAFVDNPLFFAEAQLYLLWSRLMADLVDAAGLDHMSRGKAAFAVKAIVDSLAPTNALAGNPAALRRAFDTGGASVVRGARNFLTDLATNRGLPRQVDTTPFTIGENLAATPGKVVFRNDLMELIQYEAQTPRVYEIPLVLSPPWINKYYVMDLAPGRSFVEWAVTHGHTTFVISYRNPSESMRDVTFDDYLVDGPLAALDVATETAGRPRANVVGLCLGGTLAAMMLAHLARRGEDRVESATLLNTLVDFSEPGVLGLFTDPDTVVRLGEAMADTGYLEARQMAAAFDALRANDLVLRFVVTNWLMGEQPPAFDLLAWNADSTRMPAAMHSAYLQSCYVENRLARGEMVIAGTPLTLADVTAPVYVLAAKDDHIAPWKSQYRTTKLLKDTRFVLSSSGHIAGIVNPPNLKASYSTNDDLPDDPDAWLAGAAPRSGSWWDDWADWVGARAGRKRRARAVGSSAYPPVADAPGTYVRSG